MTYQITIGNQIFSNVPFTRWQEIKDTKMYDLVTIDGREYRRSEVRCNTISTKPTNSQVQHTIDPEAYTPLDEFQTIKFHLLSGLIGKAPTSIHLHACEDISAFWKFYKAWSTLNLIEGLTIRGWLSQKSDTLEGRVARCRELYDLYLNQKNLASARVLPF